MHNYQPTQARISVIVLLYILHLMLVRTALALFVCKPVIKASKAAGSAYEG